ncbi:MAG: hypothetical protein PHW60_02780 [Kiritimatiellae bacterium]|nr:hypothetical protein [Kiritimatiellia bacterium]
MSTFSIFIGLRAIVYDFVYGPCDSKRKFESFGNKPRRRIFYVATIPHATPQPSNQIRHGQGQMRHGRGRHPSAPSGQRMVKRPQAGNGIDWIVIAGYKKNSRLLHRPIYKINGGIRDVFGVHDMRAFAAFDKRLQPVWQRPIDRHAQCAKPFFIDNISRPQNHRVAPRNLAKRDLFGLPFTPFVSVLRVTGRGLINQKFCSVSNHAGTANVAEVFNAILPDQLRDMFGAFDINGGHLRGIVEFGGTMKQHVSAVDKVIKRHFVG